MTSQITESTEPDINSGYCAINPVKLTRQQIPLNVYENKIEQNVFVPLQKNNDELSNTNTDINPTITKKICFRVKSLHPYYSDGFGDSNNIPFNSFRIKSGLSEKNIYHSQGDATSVERKKFLCGVKTKIPVLINHNNNSKISDFVQKSTLLEKELHRIEHCETKKQRIDDRNYNKCCKENKNSTPIASTHECEKRKFYDPEAIRKYIIKKKSERKSKEIEEKIQKKSKLANQQKFHVNAKILPFKSDFLSRRRQDNTTSIIDTKLSKNKTKIKHELINFEEKLPNPLKIQSREKFNGSFDNIANTTFCKLKPDTEVLQIPNVSLLTTSEMNFEHSNKIQDCYSTSLNDNENSYSFFEILKRKMDSSQERLLSNNSSTLVLKPELSLSDLNMSHESRNNSTRMLDKFNLVEKGLVVDKFQGLSNEQNLNCNNTESKIHYSNVNNSENILKRARVVLKDLNNDEHTTNFTIESPKKSPISISRLGKESSEFEIKENVCDTSDMIENQESKSSILMTSAAVSDYYEELIQNKDEKLIQILKKIHDKKMALNRHLESEITALERQKSEWRKNKNDDKMKMLKKKQRAILLKKTNSILELDKWEKTVIDTLEKQKNNIENSMLMRSSYGAFSTIHQDGINRSMDLRNSKSFILKNKTETYVGVSSTCSSVIVKDIHNKKLNDLENTLIKTNVIDRATSPMNFDNSLSKNKLVQTMLCDESYKYNLDQNMTIHGDTIKIKENLSPLYSPLTFYNRRQLSNSDVSLSSPKDTTNSTTDQSDLELRISSLQEQLKQRKLEAERLRKEEKKIRKEKLRSKEQSLIKQLEAYDNYIKRISVEIQEEKQKNHSYVQSDVNANLTSNENNMNSILKNLMIDEDEFMVNNGEASSDCGRRLKNADSGILIESEAMDERSEGNFDKSTSVDHFNKNDNDNNENPNSTNNKSTFLQLVVDLHSEVHSMSEQLYSSDFVEDTAEEGDEIVISKSESLHAVSDCVNEGNLISSVINDQENELHCCKLSLIGSPNDNETGIGNIVHYVQNENSVNNDSREVTDVSNHSTDMEKFAIKQITQSNEVVDEQSNSWTTENDFEDDPVILNVVSKNQSTLPVVHADGIDKNSELQIIIPDVNITSVTNEEVLAEETDVSESLEYDKVLVNSDDYKKQIETEELISRDNSENSFTNEVDRSLEEEFVTDLSVPQILGDTFIVDESVLEQTFEKANSVQCVSIVMTSFDESDECVNAIKTTNINNASLNTKNGNENTALLLALGRENSSCEHDQLSENYGIISASKSVENSEVKNTNIDKLKEANITINETDFYNGIKNYDISIKPLHLQELNLEKHVEELQVQHDVSVHYSVREIPDKPPPPYVAPVSNFIHAPESEELLNTVGHFIDQMTDQLNSGVYPNKLVAKQLENTRITRNSESSSYRQFVFDLAKEIVCATIENGNHADSASNVVFVKSNDESTKLSRTLVRKEQEKYDKNVMFESVMKEMHEIFKVGSKENNDKLLIRWSRKKRANDPIDDLLIRELQQEEKDWTNFVEDETKVKNNVLQRILEKLLDNTVASFKVALNDKNISM